MFSDLITIVVPVKNEEKNLPGCLENIKAFGNVIIVDSGSTDRTLGIAAEFGREVVQFLQKRCLYRTIVIERRWYA